MARMAVLGGETGRRGLFGGRHSGPELAGLGACLLVVFALLLAASAAVWFIALAVLIGLGGYAFFTPWPVIADRSPAALVAHKVHNALLRASGLAVFTPGEGAQSTGTKNKAPEVKASVPRRLRMMVARKLLRIHPKADTSSVPAFVGPVTWFSVNLANGSSFVVLRQNDGGQRSYAVVMEVSASSDALRDEAGYDRPHVGFGRLLAELGKENVLITRLQQLARAVPMDSNDHAHWAEERIPATVHPALRASYEQLVAKTASSAEQHRSFYIAVIPAGLRFAERAGGFGQGHDGDGAVIAAEIARLAQKSKAAGLRAVRPLDEGRTAALFRHLLDPSYDLDDTRGAALETVWPFIDATSKHDVRTGPGGRWVTKTAYVRAKDISPDARPVQSLRPLLTGVYPAMIRTFSIVVDLEPARKARNEARQAVVQDRASKKKNEDDGKVTDGEDEVLLGASAQRLADLKPGTAHAGASYGMYLSFTVPADVPGAVVAAQGCIEDVASECGIENLTWLTGRQGPALATVLPLGRGIRW